MTGIRVAQDADAGLLAEIGRRTFSETFSHQNSDEDMALYVGKAFGEAIQLRELRDPRRHTWIAEVDGRAAGYGQLLADSREDCVTGARPIELVRLYVDSRVFGRGVGAALMEECLRFAKAENYETFWLGVWEHNLRAQAFYRKYGLVKVGTHEFALGTDIQTDWIMSRALGDE